MQLFSSSLSMASVTDSVMALSRAWGVTGHTAQQEQQGCTDLSLCGTTSTFCVGLCHTYSVS